ncbi:unnamed protein product [Rhizophagus irregularis]|uniref:Uncharacterized protein n=1 Tax=Rhizophagus irregularis TaxID=588596 RepID=A0A2I1GTN8_9GLOM|nr:hypothetical protein RhiirA4_466250 [Rhizophagus irregularis]CAB4402166.1 unnamed protein product [Rhizophagus irregularis]
MNIWFKYKKGEPVEICFKGKNVNALKKKIKSKLKNQLGKFDINQITIRAPGEDESLRAVMLIDEKFATSYNKPVVVETGQYDRFIDTNKGQRILSSWTLKWFCYLRVICAMLFPIELRQKSVDELGLIIAYPGGGRYCVDLPSKMDKWNNWCNYL